MIDSTKIIEELGISKQELYEKYQEYKKWKRNTMLNKPAIVQGVFDIKSSKKMILFFLVYALESIEKEMELIHQDLEKEEDKEVN
jgi:hypothetical protein